MIIFDEPARFEEWPRLTSEQAQHALHAWMSMAELCATSAHALDLYHYLNGRFVRGMCSDGWVIAQLNSTRNDVLFSHSAGDCALPAQRLTRALMQPLVTRLAKAGAVLSLENDAVIELLRIAGKNSFPAGDTPQSGYIAGIRDESGLIGFLAVWGFNRPLTQHADDLLMLRFAAHHVALVIARRYMQDTLKVISTELDRRVNERTRELAENNLELRRQAEQREKMESKLKHDAVHDALTGLPNRVLMRDRLDNVLARFKRDQTQTFAVLYLDLDRFKVINDSMGHAVGDALLMEASRRIVISLREIDTVARLGGDEFAILLPGVNNLQDVAVVAQRLIANMSKPMQSNGKEFFTSASVGIAFAHSRYNDPDELLRDADAAMYLAKSRGRKRFEVFDETLHAQALRLLDMEGDLRRALGQGEFVPFYQPIVDLRDSSIHGYEALLRWRHPKRGWLSPNDFLDVAQDCGVAELIDLEIYEQVCRDLPGFPDDIYVSVNMSPRHFKEPDMVQRMLELLGRHGTGTERLRLEVTEGSLLEDPLQACVMLEQLRNAGLVTLLDDFGTGYSSLSYLHQFPIHALKIDRSFVASLTAESGSSQAVVEAVLSLAQSLGVEVIAEGIETIEQRQMLLTLGCTQGQGFFFGRPSPAVSAVLDGAAKG